jgi:arylsulfatase A-like enzyme
MKLLNRSKTFPIPLLALLFSGAPMHATEDQPNIVVIVADDWGWPDAGFLGNQDVRTPHLDALAKESVVYTHAFAAAPSCTASRGAILTGQEIYRLGASANLWGTLDIRLPNYTMLLERAGYATCLINKGWGPGDPGAGGYWWRGPAGTPRPDVPTFLDTMRKPGQRFCIWAGYHEPHRPFSPGQGKRAGIDPASLTVPPFLNDDPETRNDLADYYAFVEKLDRRIGKLLGELKERDLFDNTLIFITGDHGMPFARVKCNLYDPGTRVPLLVSWPNGNIGSGARGGLVSLTDLAPTILEAVGLEVPEVMTGRSLLDSLRNQCDAQRDHVVTARERHNPGGNDGRGYPARAIRTRDHLLIENLFPDRWPAGLAEPPRFALGDMDGFGAGAKISLVAGRSRETDSHDPPSGLTDAQRFQLAAGKRPRFELYDVNADPCNLHNLAEAREHKAVRDQLMAKLHAYLEATVDPRSADPDAPLDELPFFNMSLLRKKQDPFAAAEEVRAGLDASIARPTGLPKRLAPAATSQSK